MILKQIRETMQELNADIFAAADMPLRVIPIYGTRARSYWACMDTSADAFFFSRGMPSGDFGRRVIFHEMVHQWQGEYMPFLYDAVSESYNTHDRYFFGWQATAIKNGLLLEEFM